jgi:hypothetical protein
VDGVGIGTRGLGLEVRGLGLDGGDEFVKRREIGDIMLVYEMGRRYGSSWIFDSNCCWLFLGRVGKTASDLIHGITLSSCCQRGKV